MVDAQHKTAIAYAREEGHEEIVEMLQGTSGRVK
jgi:hypothetical protein